MSTPPDTRRLIADRLRARRARVARIRKRTLASAAGTFVLAWGVIVVQLVSGHDPALAKHRTSAAGTSSGSASPVTTSTSGSGSSSGSTSSGSANAASAGSGSGGSAGASALTTGQS